MEISRENLSKSLVNNNVKNWKIEKNFKEISV